MADFDGNVQKEIWYFMLYTMTS